MRARGAMGRLNPPQCPACSAELPKEDPGPPRDEDPGTLEVTGEVKSKTADLRKEDEGEAGEHTVLINAIAEAGQQQAAAEPLVSCDDEIRGGSGGEEEELEDSDGMDGRNRRAQSSRVGLSPTSSTSSSTSSLASVKTVVNIQNATSLQQLDQTQSLDTP